MKIQINIYKLTNILLFLSVFVASCEKQEDSEPDTINFDSEIPIDVPLSTTFQGHPGIFVLGQVDVPMPTSEYAKAFVAGAAVRTTWQSIEPTPGNYVWSFLDTEVKNAREANKKISISVLGNPDWLEAQGVPMYEFIDIKPTSSTFGQTLKAPITWSNEFVNKLSGLVNALAAKYANDTTVAYINAISGKMNNNLPATVASGENFWTATNYNPDTLLTKMNKILDVYMEAFPKTPSWNSVENVSFEKAASGKEGNYVITGFAEYGAKTYPDRFGVWREDLSGCTNITTTTGHWGVVTSHPFRNGAQMLWNVQDGPDFRMNNCGNLTAIKDSVLKAAFDVGTSIKMRYAEVYKVDVDDESLVLVLQAGSDALKANAN
jgi:hypothetical protein